MNEPFDKGVLYRNMQRPQVDRLLNERDEIISEILKLKKTIANHPDQEKFFVLEIQKLIKKAEKKAEEAKELWKRIKKESQQI